MRRLGLLAMLVLFACGCDGGSSDGGGGGDYTLSPPCCDISCNAFAPTSVVYAIDPGTGELTWENAAEEQYSESGLDKSYSLTWNCATYYSCPGFCHVQLIFWDWDGDSEGWILDSENVTQGICDTKCI